MAPNEARAVPPQVTVRIDWTDSAAIDAQHVNQVIAQIGNPTPDGVPDGIYVTFGSVPPPVVVGPDEESQRAQLANLQGSSVKVAVASRLHMSRGLVDALVQVLQTATAQYDAAASQAESVKSK